MKESRIAYFTMEVGLESGIPTYSGGLGALAGDMLRAAADRDLSIVGVSLLYRKGFFRQRLDEGGWQQEEPVEWEIGSVFEELPERIRVEIEGRTVQVRAWKYDITGWNGFKVPVILLDTDVDGNADWDRQITHTLYGGDIYYRLCQEVVLGIGGARMLRALGCDQLEHFHMNEGHASLLGLELLDERAGREGCPTFSPENIEAVRDLCIFTTHTIVSAAHDRFSWEMVGRALGRNDLDQLKQLRDMRDQLDAAELAYNLSNYVNGVAKKHAEVSERRLGMEGIDSITNGVHVATWASNPFQRLFDEYIPDWRKDSFSLRRANGIPDKKVHEAHEAAKRELIQYVNGRSSVQMDPDVFTLGFARRATAYKRADLLLTDGNRLKEIASRVGPIQIIYAGKAHPNDFKGKKLIQGVVQARDSLLPEVKLVYLENYDLDLARLMAAGSDVWLNTPQPPLEASGTSGMKAALNGVPSLSILDGWWIEGCIENVTGWAIGKAHDDGTSDDERRAHDAESLYDKLELVIMPMYYQEYGRLVEVMRDAIGINASFFNSHRMMLQYVMRAYF